MPCGLWECIECWDPFEKGERHAKRGEEDVGTREGRERHGNPGMGSGVRLDRGWRDCRHFFDWPEGHEDVEQRRQGDSVNCLANVFATSAGEGSRCSLA